jgi:putative transposase
VWRVLSRAGFLRKWNGKPSKKGMGFDQPLAAHERWHIDVSYLKICATFYYLCSILVGYSRYIVRWNLRESMTESDIEIVTQGAKEKNPEARPRIISDNWPQCISKHFKEFIRISGRTHVRTSPYRPQSNGRIERWHKSLKGECIRPGTPLSHDDARRLVEGYVEHYNNMRLNSATGYITPKHTLAGRQRAIQTERDQKLETAREPRKNRRQRVAGRMKPITSGLPTNRSQSRQPTLKRVLSFNSLFLNQYSTEGRYAPAGSL